MSSHVPAAEHELLSTSTLITFSFCHEHRQISSSVICWGNSLCVQSRAEAVSRCYELCILPLYPGDDNSFQFFKSGTKQASTDIKVYAILRNVFLFSSGNSFKNMTIPPLQSIQSINHD